MSGFGGSVKLTGESEYKKALNEITGNLKVLTSEMKMVTSAYDKNDASVANLSSQNDVLNKKVAEQKSKVDILTQALEDAKSETGENSATTKKWQTDLNNAQAELNKLNRELDNNEGALKDARKQEAELEAQNKSTNSGFKNFVKTLLECGAGSKDLGTVIKGNLSNSLNNLKSDVGENVNKVKSFASGVANVVGDMKQMGVVAGLAVAGLKLFKEEMDDTGDETKETAEAEKEAQKETLKLGDIIKGNLISEGIIAGVKGLCNAVKSVGSAFVDVGKQAVASYGEYEQLVGGVDTLFGESSKKVQEYANNAYKTAGLSANEYMETVTSFSASMIQSLGGDTEKASEVSNRAIIDMSDNANKMGTSMESIQNAYQGFAKQNYTMLDNLKLGYGGTKSEMERLIQDASKMTDVQKELGITIDANDMSFANIANAISVVQKNMGISGATSKEASVTMTGSVNAMKSSWQNLVTGIADKNADMSQLINNFTESILGSGGEGGVLNNLLPLIENSLDGIVEMVVGLTDTLLPEIMVMADDLINTLVSGIDRTLPTLLKSAGTILNTLINGVLSLLPTLIPMALSIIQTLITAILENLPTIIDAGCKMLVALVQGIAKMLPDLIPTIIDAVILMVETLLDNLDLIIDAGIQLIMALTEGLLNALPDLIDKIPVLIDKLVVAITDNLPKLIEMGIELTLKIAVGLIKAIPQLVAKIPQIITSIVDGLKNGLSKLADVGVNLVEGIWEGISSSFEWIKEKIKGWVGNVTAFIKKLFGIKSPSRLFKEEIGTNLALGIGEGFGDTMSEVSKDMANAIPTEFDTDITTNLNAESGQSQMSTYDMMVSAFKQALTDVKVVMDDREMGSFVTNTVERVVFA